MYSVMYTALTFLSLMLACMTWSCVLFTPLSMRITLKIQLLHLKSGFCTRKFGEGWSALHKKFSTFEPRDSLHEAEAFRDACRSCLGVAIFQGRAGREGLVNKLIVLVVKAVLQQYRALVLSELGGSVI